MELLGDFSRDFPVTLFLSGGNVTMKHVGLFLFLSVTTRAHIFSC